MSSMAPLPANSWRLTAAVPTGRQSEASLTYLIVAREKTAFKLH